jgi:hypothetical protein
VKESGQNGGDIQIWPKGLRSSVQKVSGLTNFLKVTEIKHLCYFST